MKRKYYTLLICLAGIALLTACDGEKMKRKFHAAAKVVAEHKNSAGSGKEEGEEAEKQEGGTKSGAFVDPSITPAQNKALDRENPWFARDFRMELTAQTMGGKVNVEIQKSGKVLYYHFWNNSGNAEMLILLDEGEYKLYQISTKNKVAQLTGTSDLDYYTFFCNRIGGAYGIVHTARKEDNKKAKQDDTIIRTETQESVNVEDERWGGFDCEKITRVTETESDLGVGMKALGGLLGNKGDMDGVMKDMKKIKQTYITWIDKASGAVVHRYYKMDGGTGMGTFAEQMQPQPSVALLTFSPDPSLIPTSLEGYKLVQ